MEEVIKDRQGREYWLRYVPYETDYAWHITRIGKGKNLYHDYRITCMRNLINEQEQSIRYF